MASLVAQTVTRLPAMQETRVGFLGREDPLEKKEMAIHSSTLAWKIPWTEDTAHGVAKSRTRLSDFTYLSYCILSFKRLSKFYISVICFSFGSVDRMKIHRT